MVIAIIAILAAMLLPALNKAREMARSVSCINNLKTLGLSMEFYQDQYDGYMVPSAQPWKRVNNTVGNFAWYETMLHHNTGIMSGTIAPNTQNFPHIETNRTQAVYNAPAKLFTCPAHRLNGAEEAQKWTVWSNTPLLLSYGYNIVQNPMTQAHLLDKANKLSISYASSLWAKRIGKYSQLRGCSPSAIPVGGDNYMHATLQPSATANNWYPYLVKERLSVGAFKAHSGGANMLWGDGHVEAVKDPELELIPWNND